MMDRARFEAIVAAYGGEPRRWPDSERAAAEAFASAHAEEVASLLKDARALDSALDADASIAASDLLAARVLAKAPKAVRALFEPRAWAALAACAVVGVAFGFGSGAFAPQDEAETMIAAVFQGSSDDFEQLVEVDG